MKTLTTFAALLLSSLAPFIVTACDMEDVSSSPLSDEYNDFSYNIGDVVTNPDLCVSQGAGSYTFAMITEAGSLGLPGSTNTGTAFAIMDNACHLLGQYVADNTYCGVPFTLEANYLQYVLTLTDIFSDVGDPYFSFTYANGAYSIGNDGCGCSTISNNGNGGVVGCKCAFPVAGEPNKRGIEFSE